MLVDRFTERQLMRALGVLASDVMCWEKEEMVEPSGIEPLTSCMPCKRSPS